MYFFVFLTLDKGVKKTFWQRLCGKSEDQIKKESDEDLEGTNCTCVLCLDSRYEIKIKEEVLAQIRRKRGDDPVTEEPKKEEEKEEKKEQR